jgi:hypothetical protein
VGRGGFSLPILRASGKEVIQGKLEIRISKSETNTSSVSVYQEIRMQDIRPPGYQRKAERKNLLSLMP